MGGEGTRTLSLCFFFDEDEESRSFLCFFVLEPILVVNYLCIFEIFWIILNCFVDFAGLLLDD